jgi:hypothetical protein
MSARLPRRLLTLAMSAGAVALAGPATGTADASTAHWRLSTVAAPSNLAPGGEGEVVAYADNLGAGDVLANTTPVKAKDVIPEGLQVVSARCTSGHGLARNANNLAPATVSGQVVTCESKQTIPGYNGLELAIVVKVSPTAPATLENEFSVEGGKVEFEPGKETNVAAASSEQALNITTTPTTFGFEKYEQTPENEDGTIDTKAGAHPYQLTTTLNLHEGWEPVVNPPFQREANAPEGGRALMRDLHFVLPPGLVGDVNAVPQCSTADFSTIALGDVNLCPDDTAIGVARVTLNEQRVFQGVTTETVPVFNLAPAAGEPARFGIEVDKVPIMLGTSVRTGSDYAVEVSVTNSTQTAAVLQTVVSFWGVPGAHSHDVARGWTCVDDGAYEKFHHQPCTEGTGTENTPAFLDMPTQCAETPETEVTGDSWNGRNGAISYEFTQPFGECSELPFNPSLEVQPEKHEASTPTGLKVNVRLPQESTLSPTGRAESDLERTTLVLPEGMQSNPGAANGLAACNARGNEVNEDAAGNFGFLEGFPLPAQLENDHFTPSAESCPEPSRIGTVRIKTPLLPHELLGSVYLAAADTNLIEQRLVLYLTAFDEASGVRVKLAGEVHLDPMTGRLSSTFANSPPVPFEELEVNFFGGPNATQTTPPLCGSQPTTSAFTPWSGQPNAEPTAFFSINQGAGGRPCQTSFPQTFAPAVKAGPTEGSTQAGAYTSFSLTLDHSDADQPLSAISVHLPEGAAAMLSTVEPCKEPPPGQEWACGAESEIGHATTSSGLGGSPFTLGGTVYITQGYDGAPFGLLVRTLAKAGPFNLGWVNVRSRINVDPNTAAVTITTDPGPHGDGLPTMLRGVPVDLKVLHVEVNRPNFEFNPTNCGGGLSTSWSLGGSQGGSFGASQPYSVTGCTSLPFAPKLVASTKGQASRTEGAELKVTLESAGLGQANIRKVFLTLPLELPSRLPTIQKACPEKTFAANPATCDEGSVIGEATIHTPVLKNPLKGKAYLVSHGGAAFPDVEFVLKGEVELVLDGKTDIKGPKGEPCAQSKTSCVTYSRFESAPDAPFSKFETVLPMGPHSALGAYVNNGNNYNLCGQKLVMPTEITAQDGAVLHQETKIAVENCGGVKPFHHESKLAKALKSCRHKFKKNKKKRVSCERAARKKYGPHKKHSSKKKKPTHH